MLQVKSLATSHFCIFALEVDLGNMKMGQYVSDNGARFLRM